MVESQPHNAKMKRLAEKNGVRSGREDKMWFAFCAAASYVSSNCSPFAACRSAFLNVAPTCLIGGMSIRFPARISATVKSWIFGYFLPHIFEL